MGRVAQMAERSLSMREVRGSIPRSSSFATAIFCVRVGCNSTQYHCQVLPGPVASTSTGSSSAAQVSVLALAIDTVVQAVVQAQVSVLALALDTVVQAQVSVLAATYISRHLLRALQLLI